jgi:hypothetical protein
MRRDYAEWIWFSLMILTLTFIKFKNQLQMIENMNTVIHLVEESLFDARYFLAYFSLLCVFFALIGLV